MDREAMATAEGRIRAAFDEGKMDAAVTAGVETYGPEILGFLLAILRDEQRAKDVYSDWTEDLVRGIGTFGWRCSFRTWAYILARHAWHRSLARAESAAVVPLSEAPEIAERAAPARTPTLPHLRTEMKRRVAELREQLGAEDQALLVLRVDRGLAWLEIADVMLGPGGPKSARARDAEAAALRKRFERIKERLKQLAREARLLDDGVSHDR